MGKLVAALGKLSRRPRAAKVEAKTVSIAFLGGVGQSRSLEDYIRELERHRWELEHRVNQIADHVAVGKKIQASEEGASDGAPIVTLVDPERDRRLNRLEAAQFAPAVAHSNLSIETYLSRLEPYREMVPSPRVPKLFHFTYGFKHGGDLPYYAYLAIRSALHFNPTWRALLHVMHLPVGPIWDKIKDEVEVVRVDDFDFFMNARLHHYAHKADIIRLLAVNRIGGIYLDIDTITRKSFDDLCDSEFCMGVQAAGGSSASGLCNAVLIGQAGAAFSTRWLAHYDYFRSKGRDDLWDYHSVKLPGILMANEPSLIRVLDYRAFFYPLWETVEQQLFSDNGYERFNGHFDTAYCFHLWNGGTGAVLEKLDEDFIRASPSIYARIAREAEGFNPLPSK